MGSIQDVLDPCEKRHIDDSKKGTFKMVDQPKEIVVDLSNLSSYKKLFDHFYVPLCLFAEHYTEDSDEATDIVQECFIKLWQRRADFHFLHQIKSFLYTSIRNQALNELEHRKVTTNYANKVLAKTEEAFFSDHVIEEETYRVLLHSIEKLPTQSRRMMLLALEGKNNKEIAETLQVTEETIHSLKKIAYKKLRVELKDYFYLLLPVI
ncbi:MAG: RNA polymerase sigma-70 factor [Odoribacter sp.]